MSVPLFFRRLASLAAGTLFAMNIASAQTPPPALPDPAATSVEALGWMQGFPPPPEKLVTFDNPMSGAFPRNRWTFSHVRETVPTANVWRGSGAAAPLPTAPRDLDGIAFQ